MSWKSYERAAERGPASIAFKSMLLIAELLVVGSCIFTPIGLALGWFRQGAAVIQEQFGPRELLRKYEWFKNAAAALDAKTATLDRYAVKIGDLEKSYEGKPRSEWARDDRQQHSLWRSELDGIAASYNELAADYNSQMSKINWSFCNAGTLPQGAEKPLPREFKPYIYK